MFSRGQFRWPRGSHQDRPFGTARVRQPGPALPPPLPSQHKIEDIDNDKIGTLPAEIASPKVGNVKLVASFSWKENEDGTSSMLVPGELATT